MDHRKPISTLGEESRCPLIAAVCSRLVVIEIGRLDIRITCRIKIVSGRYDNPTRADHSPRTLYVERKLTNFYGFPVPILYNSAIPEAKHLHVGGTVCRPHR